MIMVALHRERFIFWLHVPNKCVISACTQYVPNKCVITVSVASDSCRIAGAGVTIFGTVDSKLSVQFSVSVLRAILVESLVLVSLCLAALIVNYLYKQNL
jgi:hypothetical protein